VNQHIERARRHFKMRAYERYGLVFGNSEVRRMEDAIFAERAVKLVDFTATRAAYLIETTKLPKRLIVVLYDVALPALVTALPMTAIAKRRREIEARR
jgi:hypothetical protein